MINYNFLIDTTSERTVYSDAVFTSGDVRGYRLNFEFKEKGKALDLDGLSLVIKAKRADGAVICDMGITEGVKAFYDVKSSVYSKEGEVSFEVALADEGGMYVTAKEIIANVREGFGEADIQAEDKTPVLSAILSESAGASAKANEAKKVAQETKETVAKEIEELKASVDVELNVDSTNPVQNRAVAQILEGSVCTFAIENRGTDTENIWSLNHKGTAVEDIPFVSRFYVDNKIGGIESALDGIIAIQNSLLGGENA